MKTSSSGSTATQMKSDFKPDDRVMLLLSIVRIALLVILVIVFVVKAGKLANNISEYNAALSWNESRQKLEENAQETEATEQEVQSVDSSQIDSWVNLVDENAKILVDLQSKAAVEPMDNFFEVNIADDGTVTRKNTLTESLLEYMSISDGSLVWYSSIIDYDISYVIKSIDSINGKIGVSFVGRDSETNGLLFVVDAQFNTLGKLSDQTVSYTATAGLFEQYDTYADDFESGKYTDVVAGIRDELLNDAETEPEKSEAQKKADELLSEIQND